MARWLGTLRQYLPRRRRRSWRFVSGRRHGVGLAVFALMASLAGGYWHLTNDSRVQAEVVRYLERLTGGKVRVDAARFSIFGDITVENLRLYIGNDLDVPFFEAPLVLLRHSPSLLLLRGQVVPREITCSNPRVTLIQDVASEQWNAQRIFPLAGREGAPERAVPELPSIRLRDGRLIVVDLVEGQKIKVGEGPLTVSLQPDVDEQVYRLTFEEEMGPRPVLRGSGTIDMATGETRVQGWIGLEGLDKALTRKYRLWLQRYKLRGQVTWAGAARLNLPASLPGTLDRLTLNLLDVALELPAEEGGLKLTGVKGTLIFDGDGITVQNFSGAIAGSPGAEFTLTGRYEGYDAKCPFHMGLTIDKLILSQGRDLLPMLGKRFVAWHDEIRPEGPVRITGAVDRDAAGNWLVSGETELLGVALRLPACPIQIDQVTGLLRFSAEIEQATGGARLAAGSLEFEGVKGRHGRSPIELTGQVEGDERSPKCDLKLVARDMPLSAEIRDSLPAGLRQAWDMLSPSGEADFTVQLSRGKGQDADMSLTFDIGGQATMEYAGFPYRVERLTGRIRVEADKVVVSNVRGSSGGMTCTLDGVVDRDPQGALEMHFTAADVPLDDKLRRALDEPTRRAYDDCRLTGKVDLTQGVVRQRRGGPLEVDLRLALKDAGFRHVSFPYRLDQASGTIHLTQDRLTIDHLSGRHGSAKVTVGGEIAIGQEIEEMKLAATATELSLDADLREALSPEARQVWDALDPSGTADATVDIRAGAFAASQPGGSPPASRPASSPTGHQTGRVVPPLVVMPVETPMTKPTTLSASTAPASNYRLEIHPRDVRVRYRNFPYPLKNLSGTIVVEPGRAVLKGLTAMLGSAKFGLEGTIVSSPEGEWADLTVRSDPIALDKELLTALPAQLTGALEVREGGTIALKLDHLRFWQPGSAVPWPTAAAPPVGKDRPPTSLPDEAASRPVAAAPTAPSTAPAKLRSGQAWAWSGRINLENINLGLGMEINQLSGQIEGAMGCQGTAESLSMAADVSVSSAVIGSRRVNKLAFALRKSDRSAWLKLDDISGGVCGGKVAGFAEVRLAEPVKYGLNLTVENAELGEFVARQNPPGEVKGLLNGSFKMTATVGDDAARIATGKFSVSRAKAESLPVPLGAGDAVTLLLPEPSFTAADVDYYVRGDTLVFREIYLQGAGLSMVGSGKLNLKTEQLDLTFLAGRRVPHMDALSEMVQALTREIITVRVTGPLSKPQKQSVPLHSLDATLKELLSPGSK